MNYGINRQMDPQTGTWATTIDVPREETASLLSKVLAITSLGFLITAAGVATAPVWSFLPGIIAVFALIFAITFARKQSPALALGLFLLLTYFMGWEIGPIVHMYIRTIGIGIVFNAAVTTGLGMAAMGCVACSTSITAR
jgi:modulator of FtsH protease